MGEVEVMVAGGVTVTRGVRRVLDTVEIWSSITGQWRHGPRYKGDNLINVPCDKLIILGI